MNNVVKIICSLLAALATFLAGYLVGTRKKQGQIEKEVKKAISDINKQHEQVLKQMKEEYENSLKTKDKIIRNLQSIIERLLRQLQPLQGSGDFGVDSLIANLNSNKEKLKNL